MLRNPRRRRTSPRSRAVAALLVTAVTALAPVGSRAVTGSGGAGTITSVAGATVDSRQYGVSGDGGPASSAQLYHPRAIAFDGSGNAYIADTLNQRIRKIDTDGTITTVAGTGVAGYGGDGGPAGQAQLHDPRAVAADGAGNISVGEELGQRIRTAPATGCLAPMDGSSPSATPSHWVTPPRSCPPRPRRSTSSSSPQMAGSSPSGAPASGAPWDPPRSTSPSSAWSATATAT